MTGQARHLKAGDYRFDRAMTPFEAIDKIARGDVYVINVTFPEGLTMTEMAKIFESHKLGSAASFIKAAKDPAPIRDLDPAANDLEGYLFPETYAVPRRTDAAKLVRLMVAAFTHAFTPELRAAAAAGHRTVRQTVTLASIVEKETAKPDERPIVARLRQWDAHRDGAAMRPDGHLCDAARRGFTATCAAMIGRSTSRQYLALSRSRRPIASPGSVARSRWCAGGRDYSYFVVGTRIDEFARTLEEHTATCRSLGPVLPRSAARTGSRAYVRSISALRSTSKIWREGRAGARAIATDADFVHPSAGSLPARRSQVRSSRSPSWLTAPRDDAESRSPVLSICRDRSQTIASTTG